LLVARVVSGGLGWLPPVRRAAASLRRELEASADDAARRTVRDPCVVATALAKIALAGAPPPGTGFADRGELAYRLERLLRPRPPDRAREAVALATLAVLVAATVGAQCGALHAGALWAGVLGCSALAWVGLRPLRSSTI
ncbi:MAG TPA: hypothetical protein VNO79_17720, partial [Actinomycetota bacterium]|nr:hypothetical protein [Actinomycetota bacterium]